MSAAASANTRALADAKAKKQKKILAVVSVIFLGVVGFQIPRLMGGGNSAESGVPPTTAAISGTVPGSPLAAAPPTGSLPDTDHVAVEPGSGQLISFGLFKSKDPFVQQLAANAGAVSTTPSALPSTAPLPSVSTPVVTTSQPHTPPRITTPNGGLTPVTTTPSLLPASTVPFPSTTPVSTPGTTTPVSTTPAATPPTKTTTTPAVAPTSVAISTNGVCELVSVNGTFPGSEDIFRVVSIAKDGKSVKIGVVGGAYDSGAAAVTLVLGKKLTLVNTADGTRYVLLLQARCNVETQPVTGGTGTSTTTTTTPTATVAVPPVTTTPATTTPIVTDALDTTTPSG